MKVMHANRIIFICSNVLSSSISSSGSLLSDGSPHNSTQQAATPSAQPSAFFRNQLAFHLSGVDMESVELRSGSAQLEHVAMPAVLREHSGRFRIVLVIAFIMCGVVNLNLRRSYSLMTCSRMIYRLGTLVACRARKLCVRESIQ